jgi:hypothetical protein
MTPLVFALTWLGLTVAVGTVWTVIERRKGKDAQVIPLFPALPKTETPSNCRVPEQVRR